MKVKKVKKKSYYPIWLLQVEPNYDIVGENEADIFDEWSRNHVEDGTSDVTNSVWYRFTFGTKKERDAAYNEVKRNFHPYQMYKLKILEG